MGGQSLQETFSVDRGHLVRTVLPARGSPYEHRCPLASFETVAHAAQEIGNDGITLEGAVARTNLPSTQVAVALAFLKERSCLIPVHGRVHIPATEALHLDAMTEYHALAHEQAGGSMEPHA